MKHIHVIGSLSALLFGISLVAISLVSASQVQSQGLEVTQKEMYISDEMLPDHVLYPALMVKDRVVLELAQPPERIEHRVVFAQKRMRAARALLEKGKPDLALSTATKAQKYLLSAVLEANSIELGSEQKAELFKALEEQTDDLVELQTRFSGEDQAVLEKLVLESQASLQ